MEKFKMNFCTRCGNLYEAICERCYVVISLSPPQNIAPTIIEWAEKLFRNLNKGKDTK